MSEEEYYEEGWELAQPFLKINIIWLSISLLINIIGLIIQKHSHYFREEVEEEEEEEDEEEEEEYEEKTNQDEYVAIWSNVTL